MLQFEYQVGEGDFIEGQRLFLRLKYGWKRWLYVIACLVAGMLLSSIAVNFRPFGWLFVFVFISLASVGWWLLCCGLFGIFPDRQFRKEYRKTMLSSRTFTADMNESGFQIDSEANGWRVRWPAVEQKGESNRVFVLYSTGTVFIIGKQYLIAEQQQRLREMAGLTATGQN